MAELYATKICQLGQKCSPLAEVHPVIPVLIFTLHLYYILVLRGNSLDSIVHLIGCIFKTHVYSACTDTQTKLTSVSTDLQFTV